VALSQWDTHSEGMVRPCPFASGACLCEYLATRAVTKVLALRILSLIFRILQSVALSRNNLHISFICNRYVIYQDCSSAQ
jgi:hypothetical protein